jgi:protoporphyrinogen oxidase
MIVIIGAGISGLTAARNLDREYVLLEKENYIGGLSTQYTVDGHSFDFGGHYFHFQDKAEIKTLLERVCVFKEFSRKSKTFVLGRFVPFPVQFHLSSLPAGVRERIVKEVVETPFTHADNLHDFLEANFGKTLFGLFFKPFLSKYYNVDLRELVSDMDRGSIPPPDRKRIAAGAAGKTFHDAGYNPVFYYPETSLRDFIESYAAVIDPKRIHLNEEVIGIDTHKRIVKTTDREYHYDRLITSMPLKRLLEIITPRNSLPSAGELSHVSTLLVNVILKRKRRRFHWVYVADSKLPFYRVGFYPVHPCRACYLERTVSPGYIIDREKLRGEIEYTLRELGLVEGRDEVEFFDARVIPVSYILFTREWRRVVPFALEVLEAYGIYSIGRYGSWNYSSMSDDIRGALYCARLMG